MPPDATPCCTSVDILSSTSILLSETTAYDCLHLLSLLGYQLRLTSGHSMTFHILLNLLHSAGPVPDYPEMTNLNFTGKIWHRTAFLGGPQEATHRILYQPLLQGSLVLMAGLIVQHLFSLVKRSRSPICQPIFLLNPNSINRDPLSLAQHLMPLNQ